MIDSKHTSLIQFVGSVKRIFLSVGSCTALLALSMGFVACGDGSSGSSGAEPPSTIAGECESWPEEELRMQKPVILFVPGYTKPIASLALDVTKPRYFQTQREYFSNTLGRDVLYLNTPTYGATRDYTAFTYNQDFGLGFIPGYDSDNSSIAGVPGNGDESVETDNAGAIGDVILALGKMGRRVTIVSHSKGGQDVLHALLDGEVDSDPSSTNCRDLWPLVAGWVALTSNFFESQFKLHSKTNAGLPGSPLFADFGLTVDTCSGSRYRDYLIDDLNRPNYDILESFQQRQLYMNRRRYTIDDLTDEIPIASVFARLNPGRAISPFYIPLPLTTLRFSFRIQKFTDNIESATGASLCGANDGIVPARAAQLSGALFSVVAANDGATGGFGVDHLAPAIPKEDYWRTSFRNARTQEYVGMVEGEDAARYLNR